MRPRTVTLQKKKNKKKGDIVLSLLLRHLIFRSTTILLNPKAPKKGNFNFVPVDRQS